jgi:membrane protein YqaA with SNARE-associated domain
MKKHALNIAAFVWGVAEATLFFIIPDVLLSYIGLKRGNRAAKFASLYAAIGAAVGGVIMYLWSVGDFDAALAAVERVPAVSQSMVGTAAWNMGENWIVATFLGPLSATPYKVFAVVAPHEGAPLLAFALASVLARLPRFLIVSVGAALIGRVLSRWLSERQLTWLLIGAWLLFYAVFFALMPN